MKKPINEWKDEVMFVLISKRNEFKLLGYDQISTEDIWQHLVKHVWKGNPEKRLHEVVQNIFHLQIHTYMDYLTIHSLTDKEDTLMDSIQAVLNNQQS